MKWNQQEHEEIKRHNAEVRDERIKYAVMQFEDNDIRYELMNQQNAHFHCFRKSDGKLFQFWARTGKILGSDKRGIREFIKILTGVN